ncbi:MAG: hypothetical protein J3R72DRAFT_461294 [Linnemannia gamsii]|nr:MAG: hypothetical protein J3R72DRAFT_461294 [Linnemannia gamsii]
MLHISPIARPGRFLNEAMPFVNTAGTMNFTLTSPELLDLDSYQRTLKRLITGLASLSVGGGGGGGGNKSDSGSESNTPASAATMAPVPTLEVNLGAGAAFILDTTLADSSNNNIDGNNIPDDGRHPLPVHQSFPLSFVASGQLPILQSPSTLIVTTATAKQPSTSTATAATTTVQALPALYYIRLPWNPQSHKIQCQLSARRLPSQHVAILDRILRRLCDASPGAFMIGYSDGLSGVDAGTEVVYSGENSRYAQHRQYQHVYQHHKALRTVGTGALDRSIAMARDRGDMELDHRVAGLVGHVDHHHHYYQHQHHPTDIPTTDTALPSVLLKKSTKDLTRDVNTQQSQYQLQPPQQQQNVLGTTTSTTTAINATADVQDGSSLIENESDYVLNYDFGLWEDVDQWVNVQASVDIDHLHDSLWVNSY